MTGSQTECVSTPLHQIAACALLRLAAPFFNRGVVLGQGEHFAIWQVFRETASKLLERRCMSLRPEERDSLLCCLTACQPGPDVQFLASQPFDERA
jgi:hypothetical protein